jgi:hypothetical protein
MPHNLRHRGPDPEDERAFSPAALPVLRQATGDLCWLLDHGYALSSAADLVGNRYKLTARQRLALGRCACAAEDRDTRRQRRLALEQIRGEELWIDGLNVMTALESALGGGVILIGGDDCCRDLAGLHRRYSKVVETIPALQVAGRFMAQAGVAKAVWWLDSPIANSGRLKKIMLEVAQQENWSWQVELATNPDRVLSQTEHIVVTADRVVLDRCHRWFNLAREIISACIPAAKIIDLSAGSTA